MLTENAYGGIIGDHWIDGMKNRLYGYIGVRKQYGSTYSQTKQKSVKGTLS